MWVILRFFEVSWGVTLRFYGVYTEVLWGYIKVLLRFYGGYIGVLLGPSIVEEMATQSCGSCRNIVISGLYWVYTGISENEMETTV